MGDKLCNLAAYFLLTCDSAETDPFTSQRYFQRSKKKEAFVRAHCLDSFCPARGVQVSPEREMKYCFSFFPDLVAFDDVRKKVRRASVKETWARVSTAPTHRATTAPDLERLRTALD